MRLADGDTLHLAAGLVRRVVRDRAIIMYAFNGQYPGPLISVRQGTHIVVDFENHRPAHNSALARDPARQFK